jgi:hypothetical protein
MTKKQSLEDWKGKCSKFIEEHLCIADLWEDSDPYEISECWPEAFEKGQTPEEFIREIFEEDFARQEYDDYLRDEALAHAEEEEEE